MASQKNPGILVDEAVRLQTTNRYDFNLVSRLMAKGYATLVPIFEPIETPNSNEGKSEYFVGRKEELSKIIGIVNKIINPGARPAKMVSFRFSDGIRSGGKMDLMTEENNNVLHESPDSQLFVKSKSKSEMIVIVAESGLGKSSILFEVTQRIQRLLGMNQKQSLVFRSRCNERENLLPFITIGRIFSVVLLQTKKLVHHEQSVFPGISQSSISQPPSQNVTKKMSRLQLLCKKINRSPNFAHCIASYVLKLENISNNEIEMDLTEEEIVSFIVEAFIYCIDFDITLISIDDMHCIDSYSWRAIQSLFETVPNLVLICTLKRPDSSTMNMVESFWDDMQNRYKDESRFSKIVLPNMSLNDIRALCASMIGTSAGKIDVSLYTEIYETSRGSPMFAREMIEEIKLRDMLDVNLSGHLIRRQNGKVCTIFLVFSPFYY